MKTERTQFPKADPKFDLLSGHRLAKTARLLVGHKSPPAAFGGTLPFGEGFYARLG